MSIVTDHRPELQAAFVQAAAVVSEVTTNDLSLPTPCSEFDVARLIDHIVFAGRRLVKVGLGESVADDLAVHVELDAAPAAIEQAARDAADVWTSNRLESNTTMPWGQVYSGSTLVDMYLSELVTHSWDLARAIGRVEKLDGSLAEVALEGIRPVVPADFRGGEMPFGPVVDVAGDAGAYERLAGFLGRDPR